MSLYLTELRRLTKRRLTRLLLVLLVLGLAGIATAFGFSSHQLSRQVVAEAQAKADADYQLSLTGWQQSVADCEAAKARGDQGIEERYGPNCGKDWQPQPEMFDPQWFLPYQFDFRGEFSIFIAIFAGAVALVAFIVGASFVGAEWSTGGMMNLLLWRPRRLAVLGTKLAALLTTMLGVSVLLGAFWTLAFWLIGTYRGSTAKMTAGVWRSLGLDGLRAIGLILAVGAVAFALASLGRHTAMALGAAVAVFAISEVGIRTAVGVLSIPFGGRYLLSTYAQAWFTKQVQLLDDQACEFAKGECRPAELLITWQDSALVLGVGAAVVLVVAFWMMRRRDIT